MPPGPLNDVIVVSLAVNLPGPAAAARFTELGATVTTVLPPMGDALQASCPDWYDALHEGQTVLTIDLKSDSGRARLEELLEGADLLLTSSRAAALERLGLDPESLAQRHPRLCSLAIVGHSGADAGRPGHDLTYQAENGLVRPPAMPTTLMVDLAGAERAVADGLAALVERSLTGRAAARVVALADLAQVLALPLVHGLTGPGGVLGGAFAGYGVYASADGHVALAALEPHFMARVTEVIAPTITHDDLAQAFAQQPGSHWEQVAAEHDLPLVVVQSVPSGSA
ncbi:CoA transferase [Dermacoccaceae bacterium W4C1]